MMVLSSGMMSANNPARALQKHPRWHHPVRGVLRVLAGAKNKNSTLRGVVMSGVTGSAAVPSTPLSQSLSLNGSMAPTPNGSPRQAGGKPRLLLCVSGSVAAVKVPEMAVALAQHFEVKTVITNSASHFISNVAPEYNAKAWAAFTSNSSLYEVGMR